MSPLQSTMSYASNPGFDEHRWVINIRRTLEEELEDEGEIPVSIFNVPKPLMSSDPDSYTPQMVSIGPYHHWRLDLNEMERYKLSAAKITKKHLQNVKFQYLLDQFIMLEPKIRANYHKFLDFSHETLAWMMVIDGSFLLEILRFYATSEGRLLTRVPSRMSHLVDNARRRSAHNAILRDMVMLENQIPLFVLRKILEVQYSSLELADQLLSPMLLGLCKELSPLQITEQMPITDISETAHLLDYLYDMIVPKLEASAEIIEAIDEQSDDIQGREEFLNRGPARLIKRMISSRPFKLVVKLPWTILSNLPGFQILKVPISYMFFSQDKEKTNHADGSSNSGIEKPPLMEEIAVPNVTELSKSGVRFLPTNGNILTISFDVKTATFYLPVVSLDMNTEVVLRNLVAYEASSATGPLVFTRYTELMNGIIDNEEDVKVLREKGIILNRLKSDEEAANLWNGMSKSIRLTKVPFLDKVIEDVNKYFNGRWKVKAKKYMEQYVFASWPILALLAAVFVLILMGLQVFCSVYTCTRIFKNNVTRNSS